MVVILAGVAVASSLFGDMAVYTVLPITYRRLGLSAMQVGVLLSANRWVRLLTNELARRFGRRWSDRGRVVTALVLGACVAALYGTPPPFLLFLLLRMLWGLCWSILRQAGVMTSAASASADRRGRVMGLYNGIVKVGYVSGTLLAGFLLDAVGFRLMFFTLAALTLSGILPARSAFASSRAPEVDPPRAVDGRFSGRRLAIKGFVFGTVGSGIIMSTLGHVLYAASGESVRVGSLILGVATVNGIVLAFRHLLGIVGSPAVGRLLDRVGVARAELVAFAGSAAALLFAFAVPGIVAPVAAVAFFSCGEVVLIVSLSTEASRTGRVYSLFATALDAGAAFGPLIAWLLVGVSGGSRIGFFAGALLFVACALIVGMEGRALTGRARRRRETRHGDSV